MIIDGKVYCDNTGTVQITWGEWGGNDFDNVALHKCSEKAGEEIRMPAKDFFSGDIFQILEDFVQNVPQKDSEPCRFGISEGAACNFAELGLLKVDNSLSTVCNCRCQFCQKMNYEGPAFTYNKEREDQYFDLLYKLKGHHLRMLRATDNGEPLIYQDKLLAFLKTCTLDDFKVFGITTNGELLTKEFIDELIEIHKKTGIDFVFQVSLNGMSTETRKVVMNGTRDFQEILDCVLYAADSKQFKFLLPSMVLVEDNYKDLEEFRTFFKERGINYLVSKARNTKWYDLIEKDDLYIRGEY